MGEGDPRAVSARLPGSILQATGIRLATATYLCYCVMQVRAFRRAAGKDLLPRRGARDPRGMGETRECGAFYPLRPHEPLYGAR
jgi:hypothetical protein